MGPSRGSIRSLAASLSRLTYLRHLILSGPGGSIPRPKPFFESSRHWNEYKKPLVSFDNEDREDGSNDDSAALGDMDIEDPKSFNNAVKVLATGCRSLEVITFGHELGALIFNPRVSGRIVRDVDGCVIVLQRLRLEVKPLDVREIGETLDKDSDENAREPNMPLPRLCNVTLKTAITPCDTRVQHSLSSSNANPSNNEPIPFHLLAGAISPRLRPLPHPRPQPKAAQVHSTKDCRSRMGSGQWDCDMARGDVILATGLLWIAGVLPVLVARKGGLVNLDQGE
ncbi:hypothetical protein BDQ17DRAFT_1412429, partial [Cyathus striatus]